MPETVPIPQGATIAPAEPASAPSTVPIPEGATIQGDQSTENGQGAAPPTKLGELADPDFTALKGVGNGIVKGAGQAVGTASWLLNKIPGIGETLAPKQGVTALESMSTPHTTAEKVGVGIEGLLEFMGGDEMLKGLSLAKRLKMASTMADLAEQHPFWGKLVRAGLNSLRYGTTDTGQKLLHGDSLPDALKSGATTAGVGLAAGAVLPDAEAAVKGVPKAVDRTVVAANPRVGGGRFLQSVEKALPDMHRVALAEDAAPKDLVGYIDLAKKTGENLESQFQQIMDPIKGSKVDATPIADAMESKITPYIDKRHPEIAEAIRKEAQHYRGQQMSLEELEDFRKGVNNDNESFFKKNNLARSDAVKDPEVGYKVAEGDAIHDLQYDTIQKLTGEDVRDLKKTQSAIREVRENLQNNYNRLALKDAKFRGSSNIEQLYNLFNKGISSHPVSGIRELVSIIAGKPVESLAADAAAKNAIFGKSSEQTGAAVRDVLTPKTLAAVTSATQSAQGKSNPKADLKQALDSYDNKDPDKEKKQDDIYQKIIKFRKAAKDLPEDERNEMNKRIADYSNSLVSK